MSHSQFRFILLILRHAWLIYQVKFCILAGSTRLQPFFQNRIGLSFILSDEALSVLRLSLRLCLYHLQLASSES